MQAMNQAERYKKELNDNLEAIQAINRELTVDFDALSSDSEMIKLRARALGYFNPGDHLVHIENWNPDFDEYNPGSVIKKEYKVDMDENSFRLTALVVFLAALTLSVAFTMIQRRKE